MFLTKRLQIRSPVVYIILTAYKTAAEKYFYSLVFGGKSGCYFQLHKKRCITMHNKVIVVIEAQYLFFYLKIAE